MKRMKRSITLTLIAVALAATINCAFGLSLSLPQPDIFFPKGYDTNRAEQVLSVLRSDRFKYLGWTDQLLGARVVHDFGV
jgi:hypothetical protein